MKRALPALVGLAVGLGLALLYTWVISPVQYVDTAPYSLRADYQAAYAQLAARAYAVDGDLGRARTRLALLGLANPAPAVATLGQRAAAPGGSQPGATALAALAAALEGTPAVVAATSRPARSPSPSLIATSPSATPAPSDTRLPTDTVVPSITPNLLPTRTPSPTPLSAFVFVGQQQVCDPKLDQPLLQVITENATGDQIAGR